MNLPTNKTLSVNVLSACLLSSFLHLLIFLAGISALIFIATDSIENVLLEDPTIQVHLHNHYQPNVFLPLILFCFGFCLVFFFPFLNCSFYLVPDLHSVAWVEKWKNIPAIVIVNWYLTHWSVHTLPLHLQYPPHDGSRNSMSPHCGSDSSRLTTVLARKSLSENDETCLWDNIASDTSLPSRQTSSHTAAHWDAHRAPEVPFPQLTSSVAGWHEQIMVTNVTQHRAGISVLPCSAVASCAIRSHLVSAFQYKEFLETAQC